MGRKSRQREKLRVYSCHDFRLRANSVQIYRALSLIIPLSSILLIVVLALLTESRCSFLHVLDCFMEASNFFEVGFLKAQSFRVKCAGQLSILLSQIPNVLLRLLVRCMHRMAHFLKLLYLLFLSFAVLKRLFKLDVPVLNLRSVVALAQVADLFPELFKVVSPFHHFELLTRFMAILLALIITVVRVLLSHHLQLRHQSLAHFVKVIHERSQVRGLLASNIS